MIDSEHCQRISLSIVIAEAADAHALLHDSSLSMPWMMQVCSVKALELFPFQDACVTCSFEHPARTEAGTATSGPSYKCPWVGNWSAGYGCC